MARPHPTEDREAVAKREIGHTEITVAQSGVLTGVFLAIVCLVPLVDQLAGLTERRVPEALGIFPAVPAAVTQWHSAGLFPANRQLLRRIHGYEDGIDDSILRRSCRSWAQWVLSAALGTGSETVYAGRRGWLFYRPAVDHLTGTGFLTARHQTARVRGADEWTRPPEPDPLRAILDFAAQLRLRGIRLVVVPAPSKASVHPDAFTARVAPDGPAPANASMSTFVETLRREGIPVLDTAPVLRARRSLTGRDQYLRTDTHWTPDAVETVAAALAEAVRGLPEMAGMASRRPGTVLAAATHDGDLSRMLGLPEATRPGDPQTVSLRTVEVSAPDRAGQPVLLLGDSFSNIYSDAALGWGAHAGLGEQLELALGCGVRSIIRNDDGAWATRQELARALARNGSALDGVRVVAWEFAARELSFGDWRRIELPDEAAAVPGPAVRTAGGPQRLKILDAGRATVPGTTPYRDHLRWVLVASEDGSNRRLVYLQDLADGKATASASLRSGQEAVFRLTPWDRVPESTKRLRRSEPDDFELLDLPAWLGEVPAAAAALSPLRSAPLAGAEAVVAPAAQAMADPVAVYRACCRELAADGDGMTVPGADGWYYHRGELQQMTLPSFWGAAAREVRGARKPEHADPLEAIVAYHKACAERGIALWLVPIPAKSAVYPEGLGLSPPEPDARLDSAHTAFYDLLREDGVTVIDPLPLFLAHREDADGPVFCRQDTHFSGYGCRVLARALAAKLRTIEGLPAPPNAGIATRDTELSLSGDLCLALTEGRRPEAETLGLRTVTGPGGGPLAPDPKSPVLLLADSHGLVFHAGGDMHATGAGLVDQLAAEAGFAMDLVAVRGAAARAARINVYRKGRSDPAWLAGKKVIIWCFTVREFTNSAWGVVPLAR